MRIDVLLIVEARIATAQLLEQILVEMSRSRGLTWRIRLDCEVRGDDFTADTVPVFVRTTTPAAHRLARALTRNGVGYVFYVDDNFWLLQPHSPIGAHYARPSTKAALNEVVRDATSVIASTARLAEFLSAFNSSVIQLDAPIDLAKFQEPLPRDARRIVMGFAGSIGHARDVAALAPTLIASLDKHPTLHLEIIGPEVPELAHARVERFAYLESYGAYIEFQRSRRWDVGLAPLRGTPAQAYKTDVKYREYGAQRIAGIYQDSPTYAHIRDRDTGLIASTPQDWEDAIDQYVNDAELRAGVCERAYADVATRYGMDLVAARWFEALSSAPRVGDTTQDLPALQRTIDRLGLATAGKRRRLHLLGIYGVDHLRQYGFARTLRRTARFTWRRLTRQK